MPKQEQRYQSYGNGQNNEYEPAASVDSKLPRSVVQSTPCHNPKSGTESDLCAQWRAAKAAEKSANWTVWGVIASGIGISLLLWQIMLTREAVQETGKATNAMCEANEIAHAAQRAWLRADLKPLLISPEDTDYIAIWFELTIRNEGQSLAKNIVVSRSSIQQPRETSTEIDIGQGLPIDVLSNSLPPGGSDVVRVFTSFRKPPESNAWRRYRAIIIVDIDYNGGSTRETWLVGEMRDGVVDRPWEIRDGSTVLENDISSHPYRHRKYE